LVVISAVFGSVWLSLDIWKRYNESPTAISMERNFMDWSTALPSGTICLDEKVDEAKLKTYVDRYSKLSMPHSALPNRRDFWYFPLLYRLKLAKSNHENSCLFEVT
jgi:hypothetical protein